MANDSQSDVYERIGTAREERNCADDLKEFAELTVHLEELYIEAANSRFNELDSETER